MNSQTVVFALLKAVIFTDRENKEDPHRIPGGGSLRTGTVTGCADLFNPN